MLAPAGICCCILKSILQLTAKCFFYVKKESDMKIYKHYFDKRDTPYQQSFQPKKKQHTVWKRSAYKRFLGHNVQKIKLLGLITIYQREG